MKIAYNRIHLLGGEVIEGPVSVEMDSQGNPLSWHLMNEEEPHTIWHGGTFKIPFLQNNDKR